MCAVGTPTCSLAIAPVPVCGTQLGLKGSLSGPGCTSTSFSYFFPGDATCTLPARVVSTGDNLCKVQQYNLCPKNRKRFEPCREDKATCGCRCPFTQRQKATARCNKQDNIVCPNGLAPSCLNPKNTAGCSGGKLFCRDILGRKIDLIDNVVCE